MKGDLLFVNRTPLGLKSVNSRKNPRSCWLDELIVRFMTYKHYGIDAGDGLVIHYRCESILAISEAEVCITTWSDFARDGVVEVDRTIIPAFSSDEIVHRAFSMIGTDFGGYRIKHNNCEHFSVWCTTNKRNGKQDLVKEAWQRSLQTPLRTKERVLAALTCFTFFQ